jgi:hypothetical protein
LSIERNTPLSVEAKMLLPVFTKSVNLENGVSADRQFLPLLEEIIIPPSVPAKIIGPATASERMVMFSNSNPVFSQVVPLSVDRKTPELYPPA